MCRKTIITMTLVALFLVLSSRGVRAQSDDSKFEVNGHFSALHTSETGAIIIPIVCIQAPCFPITSQFSSSRTEPGVGGTIGYNFTRNITAEAEINFFPRNNVESGRMTEGLFGVKAGKRFRKVGVFGKARPGFLYATRGDLRPRRDIACISIFPTPVGCFETASKTSFAFDLGGVIELYPTRRTIIRFDAGDTIIRFGERNVVAIVSPPPGIFAPSRIGVVPAASNTTHNFQFNAGVGFRF